MTKIKQTGLAGWSGQEGVYFVDDSPAQFKNNFEHEAYLRQVAVLERLATAPYAGTTTPDADNDSADTAGLGRPFRRGAIWTDTVTLNQWVCTAHTEGAATWSLVTGVSAEASSSSSSSSSSSDSSSSSSTVAGNTSSSSSESSSNSSSSDSTMSSSSTSSSSQSSSSSSTVAGNTSSSSNSSSSSESSSSTLAGNTSSSSSSP